MERRNFLQLLTTGTASAFVPGRISKNNAHNVNDYKELERHKISNIRFTEVELHYPRRQECPVRYSWYGSDGTRVCIND